MDVERRQSIDGGRRQSFGLDTDNRQHRFLAILGLLVDRVDRRLLDFRGFHLDRLGRVDLRLLVLLGFRLVLVVLLVLVRLMGLLVQGWMWNEFHLGQRFLERLDCQVVRLVLHRRLVQLVLVVLDRRRLLELLVVHQVRVLQRFRLVLVVREVRLDTTGMSYLVVGMELLILRERRLGLGRLVVLEILVGRQVLVVLEVLEDKLELEEVRIGSELEVLLRLDASDGRCC